MTEIIDKISNVRVPEEMAIPAKPSAGNPWEPSKYVKDQVTPVYSNADLDNYEFLDVHATIPANAYLKEKTPETQIIDESFKKGREIQEARKADKSFWEPATFVYGAKRVSKENSWNTSNYTIKLERKKTPMVKPRSLLKRVCAFLF